jgi:tetratricopeptide (TPR) repeat protein
MNNFHITDPTYLRTIHDGLLSGAVHKDNASALPMGLVGMYEETLPPAANVNERKKFLEFFSIWALLKKEVSANFVLQFLFWWNEEEILEYIAQYSKWFNSPVSGKYVLYHERLRTFVLQKVSNSHFERANQQIIYKCQLALQTKASDEWERYALEYLSSHILIRTMVSSDGSALKALAYDTNHWNRQIEISKEFEWSKSMLKDMMLWASKYDEDEVIECALNKVDLYHQEQNDAPRIVELVAQNDIETALQRIESFGGNDKDGLQRKFILYMLCLMELTLLDSKDKPFRKEAIEKLLKHLDDNLPDDPSVLNWGDFFPSYTMFKVTFSLAELELDYLVLFNRTLCWDEQWIANYGNYSDLEFVVLSKCLAIINSDFSKSRATLAFCSELAKQGEFEMALEHAGEIVSEYYKCSAYVEISCELFKQGRREQANVIINNSLQIARLSSEKSDRFDMLVRISSELFSQGKIKESEEITNEILDLIPQETDDFNRCLGLETLTFSFINQGKIKAANKYLIEIVSEKRKCNVLRRLAREEAVMGRVNEAVSIIYKTLDIALTISNQSSRNEILLDLAHELWRINHFEEAEELIQMALDNAFEISDVMGLSIALRDVACELSTQGNFDDAIKCVAEIPVDTDKDEALREIAFGLFVQRNLNEALECIERIRNSKEKFRAIMLICDKMSSVGQFEASFDLFNYLLEFDVSLGFAMRDRILIDLIEKLTSEGETSKALNYVKFLGDEIQQQLILQSIPKKLASQGNILEAIDVTSSMDNEYNKCDILFSIVKSLVTQNRVSEAVEMFVDAVQEQHILDEHYRIESEITEFTIKLIENGAENMAFDLADRVGDELVSNLILSIICKKFASQGRMKEVIDCAEKIRSEWKKIHSLIASSEELRLGGNTREAFNIIHKAYELVIVLKDLFNKSFLLQKIAVVYSELGNFEEAFKILEEITNDEEKFEATILISCELVRFNQPVYALKTVQEIANLWKRDEGFSSLSFAFARSGDMDKALYCMNEIRDNFILNRLLESVSIELLRQGKIEDSIELAQGIIDESTKNSTFRLILSDLSKGGYLLLAEEISLEFLRVKEFELFWKELAESLCIEKSINEIINIYENIMDSDAKFSFLVGLGNKISATECRFNFILKIMLASFDDLESLNKVLQKLALQELFLQVPSNERLERFNRTLNIQWALDIKNSFSAA